MDMAIISIILVVIVLVSVYFGFWMGRHTINMPPPPLLTKDNGPVPIVSYDPYDEAMADDPDKYVEDTK